MSDNLNQQYNDFRLSQMDQFKGMSQFMQNQQGNDDFINNSNNENGEQNFLNLNTMDYYNNLSSNDKSQKNISEIDQYQEEMMKFMENLSLGQNKEGLFNPIPNNDLGMNQMRGPIEQMKPQLEDEEFAFNLNNAFNQLSANQNNNQFGGNKSYLGNLNISENFGNLQNLANEGQNKKKSKKIII